jgi:hypothetical protein
MSGISNTERAGMARSRWSFTTLARASGIHVAIACLAMGSWAFFANRAHGAGAFAPAIAQAALSGLITLVLKKSLERMSVRLTGFLAYVLPPLVTASAILILLVSVHALIGTPEIIATIAVPWSVSTTYAFVYSAVLAGGRHEKQ